MWRYGNNGNRYLPGQMAKSELDAFKKENTVTVITQVPPADQPPSYPPPPRKG